MRTVTQKIKERKQNKKKKRKKEKEKKKKERKKKKKEKRKEKKKKEKRKEKKRKKRKKISCGYPADSTCRPAVWNRRSFHLATGHTLIIVTRTYSRRLRSPAYVGPRMRRHRPPSRD